MPQPNDPGLRAPGQALSRSLVALDQDSTIIVLDQPGDENRSLAHASATSRRYGGGQTARCTCAISSGRAGDAN
jgi:hypothetical protein